MDPPRETAAMGHMVRSTIDSRTRRVRKWKLLRSGSIWQRTFFNFTVAMRREGACCASGLRASICWPSLPVAKVPGTDGGIGPKFVKPYVKTNKNDMADAEAICEAVGRPTMRFVPMKNGEQQAVLALHRARQGFVRARTAQANQIRGLLAEYGITIPQGICQIGKRLPYILEDGIGSEFG